LGLFAALAVAACGGGDTATVYATDTSAEVTTATTVVVTDTTLVSTTTAPETTTTTEAAADPLLDAALAAAGVYTGTRTNTTFDSEGDAGLTMTVSDSGDVSLEWDLGGFVFGAADPDGETTALNVADLAGGRVITSALSGDIEIVVSNDFTQLTMDAEDVPAPGIQTFRATAQWAPDGSTSGTYVVEFEGNEAPAEAPLR
jgi:hypothetical protein